MNALLICPAKRAAVSSFTETGPLCNLRLLGQTLLEYWLSHLASTGAKRVVVLSSDRPEQVRASVGDGALGACVERHRATAGTDGR